MANLDKLKTLIPMNDLEISAQQQIYNALNLDFLEKLVIMPDCHTGYSLPIGGVALLNGVISPDYVGFDEGCGMTCVITDILADKYSVKKIDKLFDKIYKTIPVGFNMRDNGLAYREFKSATGDKNLNKAVNDKIYKQIGTLGRGNHFLEVGKNKDGFVGVTIHSGSRNPGHTVASYYMKKSKEVDKHLPNGFLDIKNEMGKCFIADLEEMLQFALANRSIMMEEILSILGCNDRESQKYLKTMINETHNHAIVQADGKVLHRKGATESKLNQLGVIPGNMRDGVYVVKGLGNEEYLCSSSHGAGRKGSRKWAKEKISMDRFEKTMKGIKAKVDKDTLDESPDAYKDIDIVIKAQAGIVVDVVDHIVPIINIKG